MFLNKDAILAGAVLGTLIPFVGYALILEIYDKLASSGMISDSGLSQTFRLRTIALLAICLNLIPFIVYNRKWYYNTMRGIVFPTVIYAAIWFIYFSDGLLG